MRDTGVMIHLANVLGVGTANVVLLGDHAKIIDELSVEVERLRTQLDNALNKRLAAEHSLLDAKEQLAERDALLVDIRLSGMDDERCARVDLLLSSGAYANAINKHPLLRTSLDNAAIEVFLSASAEKQKNV